MIVSCAFVLCVFVFIENREVVFVGHTWGLGFHLMEVSRLFLHGFSPERIPCVLAWTRVAMDKPPPTDGNKWCACSSHRQESPSLSSRTGLRPLLLSRCTLSHDVGPHNDPG